MLHPNLYIARRPSEPLSDADKESVDGLGIRLVINLRAAEDPEWPSGVIVFHRPMTDGPLEVQRTGRILEKKNLAAALDAAQVVTSNMQRGKTVLVHCDEGRNRAPFVAAIALHGLNGWPGAYCLDLVRRIRPGAIVNEHFARYLLGLKGRKEIVW